MECFSEFIVNIFYSKHSVLCYLITIHVYLMYHKEEFQLQSAAVLLLNIDLENIVSVLSKPVVLLIKKIIISCTKTVLVIDAKEFNFKYRILFKIKVLIRSIIWQSKKTKKIWKLYFVKLLYMRSLEFPSHIFKVTISCISRLPYRLATRFCYSCIKYI